MPKHTPTHVPLTHKQFIEYCKTLNEGDKVIETEPRSNRYGLTGTIYISDNERTKGSKCVKWEDGLGTSITHGTRKFTPPLS